jgi:hypothetical protein
MITLTVIDESREDCANGLRHLLIIAVFEMEPSEEDKSEAVAETTCES